MSKLANLFDSCVVARDLRAALYLAVLLFVFGDLLTTGVGLYYGMTETAPFAYAFGYNPGIVLAWLAVQKFLLFFGLWAYSGVTKNPRLMEFACYCALIGLGVVITGLNLRVLMGLI